MDGTLLRAQTDKLSREWRDQLRLEDGDLRPLVRGSDLRSHVTVSTRCTTFSGKVELSYLLHAHGAELVASLDGLVDTLAEDEPAKEATRERVARTVGVNDLPLSKRADGVHLRVVEVVPSNDGRRLGAVRDDHRARAGRVRLGLGRDRARDGSEIVLVREAVRAAPRLGLSFVADDDVGVRQDLLKLDSEELGDEGCGKVEDEDLRCGDRFRGVSVKCAL